MAALVAIVVGLVLGSIAALTRNHWPDRLIVFFTTLGTAMPSLRACNLPFSVLLKARLVPGMVVHESELCTADHRAECLSDGVHHTSDKDQYAGFPKSGLHPYRERKVFRAGKSFSNMHCAMR